MALELRKVRPLVPETNPRMEYQLRTHAGHVFKFDATCFKRSDDDEESALCGLFKYDATCFKRSDDDEESALCGLWKKIRELRAAGTEFELIYHDGAGIPWLMSVTGQ